MESNIKKLIRIVGITLFVLIIIGFVAVISYQRGLIVALEKDNSGIIMMANEQPNIQTVIPTLQTIEDNKTVTPTNLPVDPTPTETPTAKPLELCERDSQDFCISTFAKGSVPDSVMIVIKRNGIISGNYYLTVDRDHFTCLLDGNFPDRLFCTGSSHLANLSQNIKLQSLDDDRLIASGDFRIIIPTATPEIIDNRPSNHNLYP